MISLEQRGDTKQQTTPTTHHTRRTSDWLCRPSVVGRRVSTSSRHHHMQYFLVQYSSVQYIPVFLSGMILRSKYVRAQLINEF